jgi:hypothetical protein
MTNDLEPAERLLDSIDYKTLNAVKVIRIVTRGLHNPHNLQRIQTI